MSVEDGREASSREGCSCAEVEWRGQRVADNTRLAEVAVIDS